VPHRPYFGSFLERASGRLGGILEHTTFLSRPRFEANLRTLFIENGVTAVHAIPHGIDFWYTFRVARDLGLPYVLDVHDDLSYNLSANPLLALAEEKLGKVWREADARFVISEPMGHEYDRRFGTRPWEMLTDGVKKVADRPAPKDPSRFRLYFMGSVHLAYKANFDAVVDALDFLKEKRPSMEVEFAIRGGVPFGLPESSVPVKLLPWGSQEDVQADMASASLLYFPLPFEPEYLPFVKYSLSTKMITYAASGIPILFHGPETSAASRLLSQYDAAIQLNNNKPQDIAQRLLDADSCDQVVENALSMCQERFMLAQQHDLFWSTVSDLEGESTIPGKPQIPSLSV
jgi:hypothetical protein